MFAGNSMQANVLLGWGCTDFECNFLEIGCMLPACVVYVGEFHWLMLALKPQLEIPSSQKMYCTHFFIVKWKKKQLGNGMLRVLNPTEWFERLTITSW